jgi:hypothetical protein
MPINKKTGRTDRRALSERQILRFRVAQLKKVKSRQPEPETVPEASGAPSMLSAIVESGSPHSHFATSDSPAPVTTPESPAPPSPPLSERLAVRRAVGFCVEIPVAAPRTSAPLPAPPSRPSPVAAPTTGTIPAVAPSPVADVSIAADSFPAPGSSSTADVSALVSTTPVPSPVAEPVNISPSASPVLRHRVGQPFPIINSPSPPPSVSPHQQNADSDNVRHPTPGSSSNEVQSLKRRVEELEIWKQEVADRLQKAGL